MVSKGKKRAAAVTDTDGTIGDGDIGLKIYPRGGKGRGRGATRRAEKTSLQGQIEELDLAPKAKKKAGALIAKSVWLKSAKNVLASMTKEHEAIYYVDSTIQSNTGSIGKKNIFLLGQKKRKI